MVSEQVSCFLPKPIFVDGCGNLHWPHLDTDIEIESLKTPEKYPLVFEK